MSFSQVVGSSFRTTTVGVVETTNLSLWIDELVVLAPGASANGVRQALRAAFRQFCVQSGAWLREIEAVDMIEGQEGYSVEPQDDATVLYIHAVGFRGEGWSDKDRLEFLPAVVSPYHRVQWGTPGEKPVAFHGSSEVPETFFVYPTPTKTIEGAFHPYVSLGPKDPYADDIPEFFLHWHFDAILEGATARLLAQQNKPYTNVLMAQYYARRFNTAIASARDKARRQFTGAQNRVPYRRWA